MSKNSGRFETTTKQRIPTPHGNILKVTHYNTDDEEEPYDEYKIRPKCYICGGNVSCVCYDYTNSDDPLQSTINDLEKQWFCEKPHCVCEFWKTTFTDEYEELRIQYDGDESEIAEYLQEVYSDCDIDEGAFCDI